MEEGLLRRGEIRLGRRGREPVRRGVMKAAASEVDSLCQVACVRGLASGEGENSPWWSDYLLDTRQSVHHISTPALVMMTDRGMAS